MGTSRLGNLLVEEGLLSEADRRTIKRTCGTGGSAFAKSIISLGVLDENRLANFLAEHTHHRKIARTIAAETRNNAIGSIDRPLMERLEVVPLSLNDDVLQVAMADPLDADTIAQLRFFTGHRIQPVIATFSQIHEGLKALLTTFTPAISNLQKFLANHVHAASQHLRVAQSPGHSTSQGSSPNPTSSVSTPPKDDVFEPLAQDSNSYDNERSAPTPETTSEFDLGSDTFGSKDTGSDEDNDFDVDLADDDAAGDDDLSFASEEASTTDSSNSEASTTEDPVLGAEDEDIDGLDDLSEFSASTENTGDTDDTDDANPGDTDVENVGTTDSNEDIDLEAAESADEGQPPAALADSTESDMETAVSDTDAIDAPDDDIDDSDVNGDMSKAEESSDEVLASETTQEEIDVAQDDGLLQEEATNTDTDNDNGLENAEGIEDLDVDLGDLDAELDNDLATFDGEEAVAEPNAQQADSDDDETNNKESDKESSAPLEQDAIDAMLAGEGDAETPDQVKSADTEENTDVPLEQDAIDAMFAGEGDAETPDQVESADTEESNDAPLEQDAIDVMLAGESDAETPDQVESADTEESNDAPLEQNAIDAMLTEEAEDGSPEKDNEAEDESTDELSLEQAAADAMFAGRDADGSTQEEVRASTEAMTESPLDRNATDAILGGEVETGGTEEEPGTAKEASDEISTGHSEIDPLLPEGDDDETLKPELEANSEAIDDLPPDQDSTDAKLSHGPESENAQNVDINANDPEQGSIEGLISEEADNGTADQESAVDELADMDADLDMVLGNDITDEVGSEAANAPPDSAMNLDADATEGGASNSTTEPDNGDIGPSQELEAAPTQTVRVAASPAGAVASTNRAILKISMNNDSNAVTRTSIETFAATGMVHGLLVGVDAGDGEEIKEGCLQLLGSWNYNAGNIQPIEDAETKFITEGLAQGLSRLFSGWMAFEEAARDGDLEPFEGWMQGGNLVAARVPVADQKQIALICAWEETLSSHEAVRGATLDLLKRLGRSLR